MDKTDLVFIGAKALQEVAKTIPVEYIDETLSAIDYTQSYGPIEYPATFIDHPELFDDLRKGKKIIEAVRLFCRTIEEVSNNE